MIHRSLILTILFIVPLLTTGSASTETHPQDVTTLRVPNEGQNPELAIDARGILHLVYGRGNDAWYTQSANRGRTWREPVKINSHPAIVTVGGERGPRLALGKEGTIHVAWTGNYKQDGGVWYTRSVDGGLSFAAERNLLDTKIGTDGVSLAVGTDGRVWVFWLDGRLPKDEQSPTSEPIFMSRSKDDGVTFSANEQVKHNHPGRACACCRLESRAADDGMLYIAFRSGYHNIRDFYWLKGRQDANDFQATRISEDNWELEGCPMSGPSLALDKNGQVLAAWMSRKHAYWTITKKKENTFLPRITTPEDAGNQNHPTIVTNRKGEVLLLWQQNADVFWARYDETGRLKGQSVQAGTLNTRSKATAFAGHDNRFYVIF
jgi:hypothetical protein